MSLLAAALAGTAVLLLVPSAAATRLSAMSGEGSAPRAPSWSTRLRRLWSRRRGRDPAASRDVVQATDLLAALLASGLDPVTSVSTMAPCLPQRAGSTLASVATAMRLGATAAEAWAGVTLPAWQPVARAMARSERTGSPLADVLADAAEDLRRDQRRHVQVAARSAGVRAVGPLAACFLPGFLLLGVVPVVASLADSALHG